MRESGSDGFTCMLGSTLSGGLMTPCERLRRSLALGEAGACPSVSDRGWRSRSDGSGSAAAAKPAIMVAATRAAELQAMSAFFVRAMADPPYDAQCPPARKRAGRES